MSPEEAACGSSRTKNSSGENFFIVTAEQKNKPRLTGGGGGRGRNGRDADAQPSRAGRDGGTQPPAGPQRRARRGGAAPAPTRHCSAAGCRPAPRRARPPRGTSLRDLPPRTSSSPSAAELVHLSFHYPRKEILARYQQFKGGHLLLGITRQNNSCATIQ